MGTKIFSWDWQEQAPMDEIAASVAALTKLGRPVYLTPVTETGDDQYAVAAGDVELTAEQATQLYMTPDAVVRVEVTIEPNWVHQVSTEIIDVPLSALIGLNDHDRHEKIISFAEGHVNNVCSWGASEVETVDYPDDDPEN
jgi:hypothetical protein